MELTLSEVLKKGVDAHKTGQFEEANRLYTVILKADPKHPDANHNMGVLVVGLGKIQEALPFFKTALDVKSNIGQFWLSYINALMKLGRVVDAQVVFNQAKGKGIKGAPFDRLEQQFSKQGLQVKKANILDTIKLEKALTIAKQKTTAGQLEEAKSIYQDILKRFTHNKQALVALKAFPKIAAEQEPQAPSSEQIQSIISLYTQGQLKLALYASNQMLELFPNAVVLYNFAGAANVGLMQFDAAIANYKQAIRIKPDYAEAYYNMGIALGSKGEVKAAINSYKQALQINPDYAEAYNNMGMTLHSEGDPQAAIGCYSKAVSINPNYAEAYNNMGNVLNDTGALEAAIKSYKHALRIRPNYAEAYNNMGGSLSDRGDLVAAINSYKQALEIKPSYAEVHYNLANTLNDKGEPEAAIDSYNKALEIKANYAEVKSNLVHLLTSYAPQRENSSQIVTVNESIRKIDLKDITSSVISNDQVVNLFSTSLGYIVSSDVDARTTADQTYRRSSAPLDCKRHMSIFNKHDIIPKFCFGCYKVQVEPKSIIDLIKVFIVFDQLKLDENNTRKCMTEFRPKVPGFYKGLIYCSGLKEANQIAVQLNTILQQSIGPDLCAKVKRGCSEYPLSFPDYKEINNSGPQLMNYNEGWKVIEDDYDRENPIRVKENLRSSLSGLNLNDILVIRKWIDYAKGIGDSSVHLLNQNTVYDQKVYDRAKKRLTKYHFSP